MHSTIKNALRHLRPDYMPFSFRTVYDYQRDGANACRPNDHHILFRLADVFLRTWDLGFTAFGGPPVHFQILHQRFVDSKGFAPWVNDQTYHELFAVSQALPGPASTKMLFNLVMYHAGLVCATFGFFLWSLPGALGMFLLSIGVGKISEVLPGPIYGLLSGLNASTVGIVALAAVQLATIAITDPLSRILVIFGACAGLCYTALWYFPVMVGIGGVVAVVWDIWLSRAIGKIQAKRQQKWTNEQRAAEESQENTSSIPLEDLSRPATSSQRMATSIPAQSRPNKHETTNTEAAERVASEAPSTQDHSYSSSVWTGIAIIILFFASFAAILTARGVLKTPPLILDLFANMYLAGTIIFGGGPVVIPLLREYTVEPGWVSSRDFLIGLAIVQAFPGPNFNFAVYLGALAVKSSDTTGFAGALLGFLGIFVPGLTLSVGVAGIWQVVRTKAAVASALRGINATAVGLVFTAVYRLWEIGYLTPDSGRGKSLANDPWWVVVAAITYSGSAWFKVPPAMAILLGAVLGLGWYGVAGKRILGL
ncbi:chromate ion transporter-like protein [Aureobasidium pullulans]|uniref:Chromate ion transporter-like protein n=1 Tax=Aureobasidium pullulans TaxID=5580 RepID=A0A4S9SD25_AURPU|nr:chromate ion transporter-like protein [Aureobasidium pullulans]